MPGCGDQAATPNPPPEQKTPEQIELEQLKIRYFN